MRRDELRQEARDLNKDLREKESEAGAFESGAPSILKGEVSGDPVEGVMGDSRPDQTDPDESHFVPADDDPNLRITRRTSELHAPERRGAEEIAAIRHDDSAVIARPQLPLGEEGAELRARRESGEDS